MRFSLKKLSTSTLLLIAVHAYGEPNSLSEEVVPTVTPSVLPVPAENVDLKEVVEVPALAPVLEPLQPEATAPESTVDLGVAAEYVDEDEYAGREEAEIVDEAQLEVQVTKIPDTVVPGKVNSDLVLLGSTVAPGTAARLAWMPGEVFSGISSPTPVLVVNGAHPGPRLCLTAAVHGDELNGIEIVRHSLYNLDPKELSGSVIGIPIVNLQGFQRSSRYLPDRRDLNRYFPGRVKGSAAARMAHSLFTQVILHCDYLVDLHTGSFRRTNLPQLRGDMSKPEVVNLAKKMGAIVVLQSRGHPGSLRSAAVRAGIPAVTMELGQPLQLQKDVIAHGIKSIDNLIDSLGMAKRLGFFSIKPEPVYYQSSWVRAAQGGILFSTVNLGDRVVKGAVLGVVTDPITNARHEIIANQAGRVIGMALNQVMYPGFAAYHIGLQSSAEEVAEEEVKISVEEDGDSEGVRDSTDLNSDLDPRLQEDSE